jgi:hypothetical protein
VQQNILNAEYKEDKIFVTKWKLCEEKNHSGAAKLRISNILKTKLVTSHSYSHTLNSDTKPIVNASQPSLLLEGVFNGFLYLMADP